tara:strand:- start:5269 stop:5619 length:351 start_codon:yes stop_codon:yes gene_type:complete
MVSETRAQNRKSVLLDAHVGEAIPGLPDHVVVENVLNLLPDPTTLAKLKAMNRAIRDAVVATGLRVEETYTLKAALLGHLSTLQHLHRRGRLGWGVCEFAARGGKLEVLQWARANG